MQKIKDEVSVSGLKPEIIIAWNIADQIYEQLDIPECVLTSGTDGVHKTGSLHYNGYAIDIRTRNFPNGGTNSALVYLVCNELKNRLGSQYDIVKESHHIHIEFDPK